MTIKEAQDYYQRKSAESVGRSINSISEANQTERDLISQLILVATAIIAVTGAILASGVFANTVTISQGIAATVAATFGLISIAFGVLYYLALVKFNVDWAIAHRDVALKLEEAVHALGDSNQNLSDEALSGANEITSKHKTHSPRVHLYINLACLALSSIGLITFAAAVIFNWHLITGIKFL
jgi:hypothetical protein